jgi:hypothetical protein
MDLEGRRHDRCGTRVGRAPAEENEMDADGEDDEADKQEGGAENKDTPHYKLDGSARPRTSRMQQTGAT